MHHISQQTQGKARGSAAVTGRRPPEARQRGGAHPVDKALVLKSERWRACVWVRARWCQHVLHAVAQRPRTRRACVPRPLTWRTVSCVPSSAVMLPPPRDALRKGLKFWGV